MLFAGKRSTRVLVLVASAILALAAAAAGSVPWSASLDLRGYSKSIWRGWTLEEGNVYRAIATIGYQPFSLKACGTCEADASGDYEWERISYTFDYTKVGNNYNWSLGHIWYTYPQREGGDTNEEYASITAKKLPWSPTLSYYHDYDEGEGDYALLSLSTDVPVGEHAPWRFGLAIGYNIHQWRAETGFSDCAASLSIPVKLWSSGPVILSTLTYSKSLDKDYFDDEFYVSIKAPLLGW